VQRTAPNLSEIAVLQKTLLRILGCALLSYGSAAQAFTLIAPQEQLSPGSAVTDTATLSTQTQPIVSAIRSQVLNHRLLRRSAKVSQAGRILAANTHTDTRSDVDYLAAALGESPNMEGGAADGTDSLWISTAYNGQENEFSRTRYIGDSFNAIAGFDLTRSDRYVVGVAVNGEARNFSTLFNAGNEKTRGYNISPYFAYLLSEAWSVDFALGHGAFKTRQSRSLATGPLVIVPVDSEFDSTRDFASANLTNVLSLGNWKLTDSLGAVGTKLKQDAYMESDGTPVGATSKTLHQWSLSGEAAYGRGDSETFFGLTYEKVRNPLKIVFATGEQPANDPSSVLVTAGWRYFGKRLTANFMFSSRQAQEQVREYGVSMMLRVDL
jgi:Autotransporter beta-domain